MCCAWLAGNAGPKKSQSGTTTQLCQAIFSHLGHVSTIGKHWLINSNISPTCPYNMVNFGLLAAQIISLLWGTPANFNGFHVLAVLLCGTPVQGVSQTLRHSTEGAAYIWQGGHHVGHWPTFLVCIVCLDWMQSCTLYTYCKETIKNQLVFAYRNGITTSRWIFQRICLLTILLAAVMQLCIGWVAVHYCLML